MKKFFLKAAMLVALPLFAISFASCSDDDPVIPPFESELIGDYTPYAVVDKSTAVIQPSLLINADWKPKLNAEGKTTAIDAQTKGLDGKVIVDAENKPVIVKDVMRDTPTLRMDLDGDGNLDEIIWPLLEMMYPGMLSPLCTGGLETLYLTNKGTLEADYHELEKGTNPLEHKFQTALGKFPGTTIPADLLTYTAENGILKLMLNKKALDKVVKEAAQMDNISSTIDKFLGLAELPLESTPTHYIVPLKYKKNYESKDFVAEMFGGHFQMHKAELFIYVDRAMMAPMMPGLKFILETVMPMLDPATQNLIKPLIPFLDEVMAKSNDLQLGICLQKKAVATPQE